MNRSILHILSFVLLGFCLSFASPLSQGLPANPSSHESPSLQFAKEPRIHVDLIESRIDQPLSIQVTGLSPHQKITLHAQSIDEKGVTWNSHACFRADASGRVDLAKHDPIFGSYKEKDGMGLFWSMAPSKDTYDSFQAPDPQIIELSLEDESRIVDRVTLKRIKMTSEVVRVPLMEEGLVGTYFYPKEAKSVPGIIVLGGSHGGLHEGTARVLASHGYATLALAYFGVEGLPPTLEQIPLEYFEKAKKWLASRKEVDPKHIGIMGTSRGGELVLVLASLFPKDFQAVIAYVPSHVAFGGLPNQNIPAWTYKGKAIITPLKVEAPAQILKGKTRSEPLATTPYFLQLFQEKSICIDSEIPVENIQSPLLLISGEDDKMWPSFYSSNRVLEKIKKANPSHSSQHLHYPSAGHFISLPFLPTTCNAYFHPVVQLWLTVGGTPKDDAFASKDSWHKVTAFLHTHLRGSL